MSNSLFIFLFLTNTNINNFLYFTFVDARTNIRTIIVFKLLSYCISPVSKILFLLKMFPKCFPVPYRLMFAFRVYLILSIPSLFSLFLFTRTHTNNLNILKCLSKPQILVFFKHCEINSIPLLKCSYL